MPYYLTKTNGDSLVTVEDGTIDITTTDLALVGKNYPTYGLNLNENFIRLLENFSSVDQPASPLLGQLWYDVDNKSVNFYREGVSTNDWQKIANMTDSSAEPTGAKQGDLWWDTSSQQLKIYSYKDSSFQWVTVGPQTTSTGLLRIAAGNSFRVQLGTVQMFTVDTDGNTTVNVGTLTVANGWAGTGSAAGKLGGLITPYVCERNSIGSLNAPMSFGASSTTHGIRMPFAGKILAATMETTLLNGTMTVQAYVNASANSSYELTATAAGADAGQTQDWQSSPLSFAAGSTVNFIQKAVPSSCTGTTVTFWVEFT